MASTTDTIDIKELFQTLKKRKKLIIGTILLFVLLAGLYLFTVKPVYQVKAMIEVGKIGDKPLDSTQDIKQKLEYIYGVKSKKKRKLPKVKAFALNKKAQSVFSVVVEGYNNQDAIHLTESIVDKIEKEYADQLNSYINTQKELIKLTRDDIKVAKVNLQEVEKTLKDYNEKIMNLTTKDAALAGIYTIQISQNQTRAQGLQSRISALKAKIYNLDLTISPLRIKRTKIIGEVEVLEKPVKPKKALVMIVSFITGLMFSIFLAFFLEFLKGFKEER